MRSSKLGNQSENLEFPETTFFGSKNIEKGLKISGVYKRRHEKEAKGPGGKFVSVTYFIDTESGPVGINKLGNLGYLMDKRLQVQPGEQVEIEYNGRDENDYHSFDVTVVE